MVDFPSSPSPQRSERSTTTPPREREHERDRDRDRDRDRSPKRRRHQGEINDGRVVYIANLPVSATEEVLRQRFSKYGRVIDIRLVKDPRTLESRGFAFISMDSSESAELAIEKLKDSRMDGNDLIIEMAKRSKARSPTPGKYLGPESARITSHGHRGRSRSRSRSPPSRYRDSRDSRDRSMFGHSKRGIEGRSGLPIPSHFGMFPYPYYPYPPPISSSRGSRSRYPDYPPPPDYRHMKDFPPYGRDMYRDFPRDGRYGMPPYYPRDMSPTRRNRSPSPSRYSRRDRDKSPRQSRSRSTSPHMSQRNRDSRESRSTDRHSSGSSSASATAPTTTTSNGSSSSSHRSPSPHYRRSHSRDR